MTGQASEVFSKPQINKRRKIASSWISLAVKRGFDLIASGLGLLICFPFFIIIAIFIKQDSPGPVLYYGQRCGKNGKNFLIIKFRTMYECPESYDGAKVTAQDDERITPFGRWLRDTKLNELPQLWNIFKGEMSLVGPRPEDLDIAAGWDPEVRSEVLSVRPGLTSPASVLYRDEEALLKSDEVMSMYLESILPSKLRLDQLYVRHRSFWLDLDILFWTFLVLFPQIGSYSPPEELLFSGPISRLIRRYVSWFTVDTIVTLIAMGITGVFWRSFGPLDVGLPQAIGIALGFAFLFSLSGAFFGVNRISWSRAGFTEVYDLLPPTILATSIALIINMLLGQKPLYPPAMLLMASCLAFIGFVIVRYRGRLISSLAERWLRYRGDAREAYERMLIIGGGDAGQFAAWLMSTDKSRGLFHVVGFVDDDLYKQGMKIRGVKVLGRREDIPRLVKEYDVGYIVFAIHNISFTDRQNLLDICAVTQARLIMWPDFLGVLNSIARQNEEVNFNEKSLPTAQELVPNKLCQIEATETIIISDYKKQKELKQPEELSVSLAKLEQLIQLGDTVTALSQIQLLREFLEECKES